MLEMIARDITRPYSAFEAWSYDRFIAPAVNDYVRELQSRELGRVVDAESVLDVGCGGGQNLCSLGDSRPDVALCGLDLSPRQVARATKRGQRFGARFRAVEGSALDMPFGDGEFDVVLSIGSIKHWPDPAKGLRECTRVLAPGGALIIAEVDRGCRLDDARSFVQRWRLPALLDVVALAGFRTWVAGQGLDLDEARALLADLPLAECSAERVADTPFLVMRGIRAAAEQ